MHIISHMMYVAGIRTTPNKQRTSGNLALKTHVLEKNRVNNIIIVEKK